MNVDEKCLKRHVRWKNERGKDGYIEESVEKRLPKFYFFHEFASFLFFVFPGWL